MDPRKRHAPSRSRGNSPPTQRRRESEQSLTGDRATPSATTDRYAHATYHRDPPSPPHSEKTPSTGAPTRPMSHPTNERHIDHIRRESVNSQRLHADQTPMHVMSPASIRSGSSTPLNTAPTVPSMLPVAQKPTPSRHMDTLNALRSQKLSYSAKASQNPESSSNTAEVRALKAQLKARELQDAQLRSEVRELKENFLQLQKESQTQLQTLQIRMDKAESDSAKLKHDLQQKLERSETNEQRLFSLRQENHIKEVVAAFIGPILQAYSDADQVTIVQRIASLEDTCKSLSKEQNDTSSQIKSILSRSFVDPTDLNTVKSHLDEQEKLAKNLETHIVGLSTHVKDVEAKFKTISERGADPRPAVVDQESTEIKMRLCEVEKRVAGPNGVQDAVEELRFRVGVQEKAFPKILQEKCDSSEALTDKKLSKLSEEVAMLREQSQESHQEPLQEVNDLKQRFSDLQDTAAQKMSEFQEGLSHLQNNVTQNISKVQQGLSNLQDTVAQKMSEFQEGLSHLQNNVATEVEHRKAAVEGIKQLLDQKHDTAAAIKATDTVKLAVRNLQAQYENISTDDLFQKMSHWFLQQYPTSSADTLQQLATVRHDVAQMRSFTDSFTRIPNSAQALVALANLSSQIVALVETPLGSIPSPETRAKYDTALSKTESFEKAISGLQKYVHILQSENTPFVRKESLERSMGALQAGIDRQIEEEVRARSALENQVNVTNLATQELTTKLETGLSKCFEGHRNIELVSNQRFEGLEAVVESVGRDTAQLRLYIDDELKDFNDPAKRDCFHQLPALFVHVTQVQLFVENLNQNVPKSRGLDYKWACDFTKKYPVPSPFPPNHDILAGDI